ncbi:hypothetical protein EDD11_008926 [Mortierella claussenii]|nr:hypothetical protein EDD11_008926 [Mortierella claussenii]
MNEHDERTSLVRSNSTLNRVSSGCHDSNNGYITGTSQHHHNRNNQAAPSRTPSRHEDFAQRDLRTFLVQVQRSLSSFQAWATKVLHGSEESSVVNWVQNARVARTFMLIINVILAVLAFLLIGVEMVEMALREPILDYLLPESEITLFIAGLTIVTGVFGFAVAYNLLVEEDTTNKGNERDNDEDRRGNGSVLIVFTVSIAQRSIHLAQMEKELNRAWTETNRHRTKLISDFELRYQCCGFNSITDRPFPPVDKPEERKPQTCSVNHAYGFKVPCKAELTKDFERWQKGIQHLLLVQMTLLLPLLLLVMTLSAIGFSKLKERKQEGHEDAEVQAEATTAVLVVDGRGNAQYERPLLEDVTPHNGGTPFVVNAEAEPLGLTHDRPVEQQSLI